jgi:membrane-associated phospholipid phosphatase
LTDDATYTPSARLYTSSPAAKKWSDFFAEFGDGTSQFALAGSLGAYGILFGDDKALRTGTEIVEVVIASGAVVQVLKHLTGRESPYVRSSPTGVWKPFPGQIDYHRYVPHHDAFPSGHICTSLATVIVVAENYPDVHWIRPLGYTLTTLVGIGMGTNGIHWYSDYPLGLFLGYTFGMIASHPEGLPEEFFSPLPNTHLSVLPVMQQNGAGIDVTLTF